MPPGQVDALDLSLDGSVAIGCAGRFVLAHSTATAAILWQIDLPGSIWSLRIHGGVVVVPVDGSDTMVLDVSSGHQVHVMPPAGDYVHGVCVFDGLIGDVIVLLTF